MSSENSKTPQLFLIKLNPLLENYITHIKFYLDLSQPFLHMETVHLNCDLLNILIIILFTLQYM